MTRARLQAMVDWLRANYPTPYPVQVSVGRLGAPRRRVDGVTHRKGRKFYIILDNRLAWSDMREVLCHEWAHAVAWGHHSLERRRTSDHDDHWALTYGRIYRDIYDRKVLG